MILGGPWPVRVVWLLLPFSIGPALESALGSRSTAVQLLTAVLCWSAWTAGVVAVLVPRALGLTALRVVAPAAALLGIYASLEEASTAAVVAAVVSGCLAVTVALAPTTGDVFVNGSAYGDERRFALRPPTAVLLGPLPLIWLATAAGTAAGPLLLATGQWAPGVTLCILGPVVAVLGFRSLHQLTRRWLVFVPAGVVIHDQPSLVPQLFRSDAIASFAPAHEDSGALDLTAGAAGLALEIQLRKAETIELAPRRGQPPKVVHASAVMFTPTLPGAVLAEAARRGLPRG